jgi:hypothetical protein
MTIASSILPSTSHGFSAIICGQRKYPPPIYISTNPSHLNLIHLRDFFTNCNYSCHRFPNLLPGGIVDSVDVDKLRLALSNSSVVVSVFSKPDFVPHSLPEISNSVGDGGDWLTKLMPVSPFNGQLVGFGRAVSDSGFTASIYDVTCLPGSSHFTT